MIDITKLKDPSPWHPIKDPVDLKHLGKLAEELGECISAVNRCIIQGVDEKHPVTEKVNKEWLEDEIADVMAGFQLAALRFNLNEARINERVEAKIKHLAAWHKMA